MEGQSINISAIEDLKACSGSESPLYYKDVIMTYLTEVENRLVTMHETFQTSDAESLGKMAHAIHGSSLNVGATILAMRMQDIERITHKGAMPNVDLFVEAKAEFGRVKMDLRNLIS